MMMFFTAIAQKIPPRKAAVILQKLHTFSIHGNRHDKTISRNTNTNTLEMQLQQRLRLWSCILWHWFHQSKKIFIWGQKKGKTEDEICFLMKIQYASFESLSQVCDKLYTQFLSSSIYNSIFSRLVLNLYF